MGARILRDCDMQEAEVRAFASGAAAVFSARRPGAEGPNQDAAALLPFDAESGVLAVADGVGGQRSGADASGIAVMELERKLDAASEAGSELRDAILDAFETTDRSIASSGGATTLVAAELRGRVLRTYHAGDSAILVVGQRGRLKHQTVPHSPVGYAVESGLLDEHDAMHHEDRHVISNAIGSAEMRIEIGPPLTLAARDTVLLASDGLFDNLHLWEVVEAIRTGPLVKVAARLVETCRQRMQEPRAGDPCKPDDLSFIVFRPTA